MWNPTSPTERRVGNRGAYPVGGIAPLQQDIALHAYLEKKLSHAEMDRLHQSWALKTKFLQSAMNAIFAYIASALAWWQAHFEHAAVAKPRS
jgi:hypothetical protein